MSKILLRSIVCCWYLFLLTSCVITRYDTRSEMVQATNVSYIATQEVSVGIDGVYHVNKFHEW